MALHCVKSAKKKKISISDLPNPLLDGSKIPINIFLNFVESLPRRFEAVVAAKCGRMGCSQVGMHVKADERILNVHPNPMLHSVCLCFTCHIQCKQCTGHRNLYLCRDFIGLTTKYETKNMKRFCRAG